MRIICPELRSALARSNLGLVALCPTLQPMACFLFLLVSFKRASCAAALEQASRSLSRGSSRTAPTRTQVSPFFETIHAQHRAFFYTYLRLIIFLHACRDRRQDLHGRRHGLNPPCRCQAHHLLHHGAAAQVLHQRGHGPRHAGPGLVQGGRPAEPAAGPAPVSSTPTPHCRPPSSLRFPA